MDPYIMKLLEDDEGETMPSGADVEAFTAAFNRDIEGQAQQTSESDFGNNQLSGQLFQPWQTSSHGESASCPGEQEAKSSQIQDQQSSSIELRQHGPVSANHNPHNDIPQEQLHQDRPCDGFQQQQAGQNKHHMSQTMSMKNAEKDSVHIQEQGIQRNLESKSKYQTLHSSNQQMVPTARAVNSTPNGRAVNSTLHPSPKNFIPLSLLLPAIQPQLDKDRAMQVHALYAQLKQSSISKEDFVRMMRSIVGDHMIKKAVYRLQQQQAARSVNAPHQFPLSAQTSAKPNLQQVSAKSSRIPSSASLPSAASSFIPMNADAEKSCLVEHQSDSHGMQVSQMSSSNLDAVNQESEHPLPIQGLDKQQQQYLHFSQASFSTYGNSSDNYSPYSTANVNTSLHSLKQKPHDMKIRKGQVPPSIGATQLRTPQAMNQMGVPNFERQGSLADLKRVKGRALSHLTNNSTFQQNVGHWQHSLNNDESLVSSMAYVKLEPLEQKLDQQKSQLSMPHGLSLFSPGQPEQVGVPRGNSKDESFEMQSSRMALSASISMARPAAEPLSISAQLSARIQPISPPQVSGSNIRTPPGKPSVGQKRPSGAPLSTQLLPSKKHKVSGTVADQSIEQLNDVTAISGVNLREEEQQLFSISKEDGRVSEASRKVVQEEEERLILQKIPLRKKLAKIMSKCGVNRSSIDVERCLSLCVEERMHGLISNLIRLSKQRLGLEKPRHQIVVTSDVHQQIMAMNQKAREELGKKHVEAEKHQRVDDSEGNAGVDCEEGRKMSSKVNKEEDEKMRTTAANVAAWAAVGGDDMMSRWKLMIEQNQQKHKGMVDAATSSQPSIDVGLKPVSASARNARGDQDADERSRGSNGATPGTLRKFRRNQDPSQNVVARNISVKDVMSVLERELQMSRSTFLYRLYERMHSIAYLSQTL